MQQQKRSSAHLPTISRPLGKMQNLFHKQKQRFYPRLHEKKLASIPFISPQNKNKIKIGLGPEIGRGAAPRVWPAP